MKTEEELFLINKRKDNNINNPIISYNNKINDFKKINSSVNVINTLGSQPIVIYKKISKSLTQPFGTKKIQKNNKPNELALRKKLNKYKSVLSFPNQQYPSNANTHIIKTNKNTKNIKTVRNVNKKLDIQKKEKVIKTKEKSHIIEINNKVRYTKKKIEKNNNNKREITKKEFHDYKQLNHKKESHSHGHFNRKDKLLVNNAISKSTNIIKYSKNNNQNNAPNYNINIQQNNKNIKLGQKKENKNKTNEESKIAEQDQKKSEYIEALIKNGIQNVSKKFKVVKKLTQKELIIKSKKEFLLENGIMENLDTDIINNKINNIHSMNNFDDIKTFKKKNIGIKNSLKKSKNINITKSNSKFIDYLNINNSNINITTNNNNINSTNTNLLTTNINQESQPSNKNIKKRIILKPKINQFEYINKIAQEQKKLITQNRTNEKNIEITEYDSRLSDSFRHDNKIKISNSKKHFDLNLNLKNNNIKFNQIQLKNEKKQKIGDFNDNDEFPFSHRKSYRSPQEITKYLKEKRIENKKEEENTEKEKQLKAYVTFKNLVKLGKKWENNINLTKIEHKITQKKSRKESKEHLKLRKEPNEYYIGTESSKNNSTFIDKKEYYISILESKNFVNQTKVSKQEDEKETENNNNKISIDIGGNDILNNRKKMAIKNKIKKKKLNRGNSTGLFENKKILEELYISINKANKIFSKESLNKFRNDLIKTTIDNTNEDNIPSPKENIINKKRKNSINNKKIINNSPEIHLEFSNVINSSNIMIKNRRKLEKRLSFSSHKKHKLLTYSISFNNISSINFPEKMNKFYCHTYSKSLNKKNIFEKKLEHKYLLKLINTINKIIHKKVFIFMHQKYLLLHKNQTYLMAFNYLIIICKFYPFHKLEKYVKYIEYKEALKELFKPFIHNRFKIFIRNCLESKIRKFILILEIFFKYKAMNKLFIFCERDFKREIINFLILTIQKPFFDYVIEKINFFINLNPIKIYPIKIPFNNNKKKNFEERKELEPKLIIEEVIYNQEYNNFDNDQINNINNKNEEIKSHLNIKELLYIDNKKELKKLCNIKNPEEVSDELTEIIIRQILNSELKLFLPYENIIPYKSYKYDLLPKSQNTSLNNSYISSSCASLDQISLNNNSSYSNLNESLLSQMSYYSEFNKTIRDKKKEQALSFYSKKIGPKLVDMICDEIKNNYNRIINNINIPLKTNFEKIVVALELKDNDQLKQNYRILNAKEELKDIINTEKIIKNFEKINKKIRIKYNQNNINENFDLFMNLNIIDTAIELINKERLYGEIGEPFAYNSIRNRLIGPKYNENNPQKLIKFVKNNLLEYINNPIFLIKDNMVNADEKNIIKYFKKDLKENEEQWEDMEIVETQSKLEVTEIILDQLYNELIEILEHVQFSRKRPDLYQEKSIYACEDIPKLSFQQTTTENENIYEGGGKN